MKTPPKGFKQVTLADRLYKRLQDTAKSEGLSMPDLLRKMLSDQYSDSSAVSGEEIKGKEYNHTFDVYQNDRRIGTFKTDSITLISKHLRVNQAPVSASGLLQLDVEVSCIAEGGVEMRGFIGDTETRVKITGVFFRDYSFEEPIVTSMDALTFEIIAKEKGK